MAGAAPANIGFARSGLRFCAPCRLASCGSLNNTSLSPGSAEYYASKNPTAPGRESVRSVCDDFVIPLGCMFRGGNFKLARSAARVAGKRVNRKEENRQTTNRYGVLEIRKPMKSLRLSGEKSLRYADRRYCGSLLKNEPPRKTREWLSLIPPHHSHKFPCMSNKPHPFGNFVPQFFAVPWLNTTNSLNKVILCLLHKLI